MIIECEKCRTRFNLDETLVKGSRFQARCSRCRHVFAVQKPSTGEEIHFQDLSGTLKGDGLGHIISISNQKGGVAKTSTCLNLGIALSLLKHRVLLIDFDIQANLSIALGYPNTRSFYESVGVEAPPLSELIIETKYPNISLLPSNRNMVLLNKKFFGSRYFEYLLRDRLAAVKDRYDFILIDTPPSIEFFTLNALTASGFVIIPSPCDFLATHGLNQIMKLIELIREKTNPHIKARILVTLYDAGSTASKLVFSKVQDMYAGNIFETRIGYDEKLRESQIMSMPVLYYDKSSLSGAQYLDLAREILASGLAGRKGG